MTTVADQLFQFGGAPVGVPMVQNATYLFVDGVSGVDGNSGLSPTRALATIQAAVDKAEDNVLGKVVICIAPDPDGYAETVTISRPTTGAAMLIYGMGPRGSVFIDPSTEDAGGMVCHRDDVTLFNVGVAAEDETSAVALTVTGSRFRAYQSKIEGGAIQVQIGPGTIAQEAAGTRGVGADSLFDDCEICWGTNGVKFLATDYGAVTQQRFRRCLFHNLTASSFEEGNSGGSADIQFRNVWVEDCTFSPAEDGTEPTKYFSLNDNNANTGVATGNRFTVALNSGKNLVSTALIWTGNLHPAGLSTTQPS